MHADQEWVSYHLYYHEDLSRAVLGFVRPAVISLLRADAIDSFFFVRYGLGGPHIRLRVQAVDRSSVDGYVRDAAQAFLERSPSTKPLNEEVIRRGNQALLAADPYESDDSVHPDNSLSVVSFKPETDRYGGPELLVDSLDLFAVSSVAALSFLERHGGESRSAQLVVAFRLILRQALGFAIDEEELLWLLGYAIESWGEDMPAIVAKGDRVFTAQSQMFRALFDGEQRALSEEREAPGADAPSLLAEAARRLSRAIGREDRMGRKRIAGSQLHMTANRLGLSNIEEVYLGRLLTCTAHDALAVSLPSLAGTFALARRLGEVTPRVRELLPEAFACLTGSEP